MSRGSSWNRSRTIGNVKACAVFHRGELRCAWCSAELTQDNAQIDHVVRRAEGGSDDAGNLVGACSWCNLDRPDVEAPAGLLARPLDMAAGRALAFAWYPWLPAKIKADAEARKRRHARAAEQREHAIKQGLGGTAFPFGACA